VVAPQSVPYDTLGPIGHLARLLAVKYPSVLKGMLVFILVAANTNRLVLY
jgi:hypothetical protein